VPIQIWPTIAQGNPVSTTPRKPSAAVKVATKARTGACSLAAKAAAAAQKSPSPPAKSTTANGAIQPCAAASTQNGSTIHDRASAKCPVPAASPSQNARPVAPALAMTRINPDSAGNATHHAPQGAWPSATIAPRAKAKATGRNQT